MLVQLCGFHKTEGMLTAAPFMSAPQCKGLGLIDNIAPKELLLDIALVEIRGAMENWGKLRLG